MFRGGMELFLARRRGGTLVFPVRRWGSLFAWEGKGEKLKPSKLGKAEPHICATRGIWTFKTEYPFGTAFLLGRSWRAGSRRGRAGRWLMLPSWWQAKGGCCLEASGGR